METCTTVIVTNDELQDYITESGNALLLYMKRMQCSAVDAGERCLSINDLKAW
jgi:hypothetical protein